MKAKVSWGAAGLLFGLVVALALPSLAQSSTPSAGAGGSSRTVTVTGSASIRSVPDEAVVALGVQTQAPTAQGALQQNASRMNDVMKAILGDGVKPADIATAWVNLYPNYDSGGTAIVSYTAQNQVNVTVRDLSNVGSIIDDAVGAGANLSSGIQFQLSDQNQGVERALAEAVANARAKAEALASAGDASLGSVVTITEGTTPQYPPIPFAADAGRAEASTPISPPTLETQVTVTVVWSLV
ncbi:MAG TPA: SIMPL domain-containing protein [Actinomycetota bacterium]|nr:SIMPL domain-containing protein [Actinomycetota bacterium]